MLAALLFLFLVLSTVCLTSTFSMALITAKNIRVSEYKADEQWKDLSVALIQYPLEGKLTMEELTVKARKYIESAANNGSTLVVFPELFALDLLDLSEPEIPQMDAVIDTLARSFVGEMQAMAVHFGVYLLAGSIPFKLSDGKIRNRSYLMSPNNDKAGSAPPVYQEKMFLTPDEVAWGWSGADTLSIFNTPWGRTAILICYDSEFPLVSQTLAAHEIDVILVPSMTESTGFTRVRWSVQARAIEHMAYAMVTGTVEDTADTNGWQTTAQGAVLGPSLPSFPLPPLVAEGEKGKDEVVYARVDLSALLQAKSERQYSPSYDQRDRSSILIEFEQFDN